MESKQTAIEWIQDKLPSIFINDDNGFYRKLFEQAKAMEKEQIEISDEEIEKWAKEQSKIEPTGAEEFGRIMGAKWYREELKKK
jgi:hypothetical protein